MNDQTVACYDQFAPMPQPVQYLAQICYASVPGWCCHARCFVPDWYYDNGCYRRSVLQRRLRGRLGGAGLQRLLRPRQPFLRGLPQRRQHRPHQPQHQPGEAPCQLVAEPRRLERRLAHDRLCISSPTAYRTTPTRRHARTTRQSSATARSLQSARAGASRVASCNQRSPAEADVPSTVPRRTSAQATSRQPRRHATTPACAFSSHQQAAKPHASHALGSACPCVPHPQPTPRTRDLRRTPRLTPARVGIPSIADAEASHVCQPPTQVAAAGGND